MGKSSALVVLLPLVAACPSTAINKPPKIGTTLRVSLPSQIDEVSYPHHRQVYESMPTNAAQRPAYRRLLLAHLIRQANAAIDQRSQKEAARLFDAAATLYDYGAVFRGAKPHPSLARLGMRIAKLFSPSGDDLRVVPALCVALSGRPKDKHIKARIWEVLNWVDQTAQLTYGRSFKGTPMIRAMERAAKIWPSRFVLDVLRKLYVERMLTLSRASPMERFLARRLPHDPFRALVKTGERVVQLYLRVGRADRALEELRAISLQSSGEENLRALLEQAIAPSANVEDQIRLAEFVEERDPGVALRVCRAGVARFGREARIHACVGRLAAQLKKVHLSVLAYQRAVRIAPRVRSFAEALAQQYHRQLFDMIAHEQLTSAHKQLVKIERFYGRAEKRLGTKLKPSLSRVHYAMGHGLYNAGKIPPAIAAFKKAVKAKATPEPLIQLATIYRKSGKLELALEYLARVEKLPASTPHERIYWQARIEGLRGKTLEQKQDLVNARKTHRRALKAWQLLLNIGLRKSAKAEAHTRRAGSLYALGKKGEAIGALEKAIDAKPQRKETYADAISLLATHGHLPEALDAYYRALGREEVTEYLKTYCSFWVIGLARRAGKAPDPLAINHLRKLRRGKHWYSELAQLFLEKATFEELAKRAADKPAQLAELCFYWAELLVAKGKLEQARTLWRRVVKTKMMAFFEYDMAVHYLRDGPAAVQQSRVDRIQKTD